MRNKDIYLYTFEDVIYCILECCLYNEARELKLRLVFLHELKIEVLLFGDDTLTELQNIQIFESVQLHQTNKTFYPGIYDHNTPSHFILNNPVAFISHTSMVK
jgi:hypothetical protein